MIEFHHFVLNVGAGSYIKKKATWIQLSFQNLIQIANNNSTGNSADYSCRNERKQLFFFEFKFIWATWFEQSRIQK